MTKSIKIDSGLVHGLKNDDHNAFKELFDLYSNPLYKFSYTYLKSKDLAEDVVQEVFTKIWEKRKDLKTDTSFKSYLFTIALNSIRKQFNKAARLNAIKHDILNNFSSDKSDFDQKDTYQELLNKLEELVATMPKKRREVFIKKKFEEKSIKEIAKELDISAKTVEYHISESIKFLKKEFANLQIQGLVFFHLFVKQ
ncbi:RNA polymerase sigma-70 factor [uncultured Draconibacterium sp.]|uniref:RNA polymerase sigma factor n=1 Tax=uncultured Draconibacterium sp. TaxID=1573823 RepID=UPI002AA78E8C|nr:RNA polymerase sigma-70 factor [uncultured Draconibacterium sp.]